VALTPLTRVQQVTVLTLVQARRLDVVTADLARATSFLRQAEERLDQLPLLTSVAVRYGVAYDACHDTGEALLAAYGFRTTNGPGQHEALGRYLRAAASPPLHGTHTKWAEAKLGPGGWSVMTVQRVSCVRQRARARSLAGSQPAAAITEASS
jgi:hypothetical protein